MVSFGFLPYFHYHENKEQESEEDWEGEHMEFHEESRLDWIRVLVLICEIASYLYTVEPWNIFCARFSLSKLIKVFLSFNQTSLSANFFSPTIKYIFKTESVENKLIVPSKSNSPSW